MKKSPLFRFFLINIFLFLFCSQVFELTAKGIAEEWLKKADDAYNKKMFTDAIGLYHIAASEFKKGNNPSKWVDCNWRKTKAAYNMKGSLYSFRYSKEILVSAINQIWWPVDENLEQTGQLYMYLGYVLLEKNRDYVEALGAYEKAKEIHEKAVSITTNPVGSIYKPLSSIYTRIGENEKAIGLLEQSLRFLLSEEGENLFLEDLKKVSLIGRISSDLGIVYWNQGYNSKAIKEYDLGIKAVEDFLQTDSLTSRDRAKILDIKGILLANKAQSLLELGLHEDAQSLLRNAIDSCLNNPRYYAGAVGLLGDTYSEKELFSKAENYYQEALERSTHVYPSNARELSKIELAIGDAKLAQKEYESALKYYDKALQRAIPRWSSESIDSLPKLSTFRPENVIMDAFIKKGEVFYKLYQRDKDQSKLILANKAFDLAINIEGLLNSTYDYESSRLSLVESSRRMHELKMAVLWELHNYSDLGQNIIVEAFKNAEQSKAVVLNLSLVNNVAVQFSGDTSLFRNERQISHQINDQRLLLEERRLEDADSNELSQIKEKIFLLQENYNDILNQIKIKNPEFYDLRYGELATVTDIQRHLSTVSDIFIEYFYSSEQNCIYLIAIDKTQSSFKRIQLPPDFEEKLHSFINKLKDWNFVVKNENNSKVFKEFTEDSHKLYQLLLQPALSNKEVTHLIISPDGLLNLLPFDVLLTHNYQQEEIDYGNLPYLIKKTPIQYVFSATNLFLDTTLTHVNKPRNYMGVAPNYTNSSFFENPSLSLQTIKEIKKELGGDILANDDASKKNFADLAQSKRYQIIHFYGHANALTDRPLFSWMAFTPKSFKSLPRLENSRFPDADSPIAELLGGNNDIPIEERRSLLYLFEIYNIRINADLVVLSACNTGIGRITPGEGTISLARAFRYSGCPTTLMSLWEANDSYKSVSNLTMTFFKYLKGRKKKSDALQQAKIDYLSEVGSRKHPAYWSSFVLIGNNEPIEFYSPGVFNTIIWVSLITLVLAIAFFLYKTKKNNLT